MHQNRAIYWCCGCCWRRGGMWCFFLRVGMGWGGDVNVSRTHGQCYRILWMGGGGGMVMYLCHSTNGPFYLGAVTLRFFSVTQRRFPHPQATQSLPAADPRRGNFLSKLGGCNNVCKACSRFPLLSPSTFHHFSAEVKVIQAQDLKLQSFSSQLFQ